MSDDLIETLVADLRPVRRGAITRGLLIAAVGGIVAAALVMIPAIGLRADIATAPMTMMFWIKFLYTLALGALGLRAALALSRPEGKATGTLVAALIVFATVLAAGVWQWTVSPQEVRDILLFGGTALICPLLIVALSAPILAAMLIAAKRFAPQSPTMGGFATGLAAGGLGAWVYAFHCGEYGLLFLGLWHTLGIALTAMIGAIAGRFLLRW